MIVTVEVVYNSADIATANKPFNVFKGWSAQSVADTVTLFVNGNVNGSSPALYEMLLQPKQTSRRLHFCGYNS